VAKTPSYQAKATKDYEERNGYKQFNRRATPEEYEKLLAYWKELIAARKAK